MATTLKVGSGDPSFAQTVSLTITSIPAGTVATQTFSVPGVIAEQVYMVGCPTIGAGILMFANSYATAAGTLQISFWNNTGSSYAPAAQTFQIWAP